MAFHGRALPNSTIDFQIDRQLGHELFSTAMTPWEHIRRNVFRCTQYEMAAIAGVSQGTISKWESGTQTPLATALGNIRRAARQRAVPWDDRWFFE
jgi:hypothetical protein